MPDKKRVSASTSTARSHRAWLAREAEREERAQSRRGQYVALGGKPPRGEGRQWQLATFVHHLMRGMRPPEHAYWSARASWRPGDILFMYQSAGLKLPPDDELHMPDIDWLAPDERGPLEFVPGFPVRAYYGRPGLAYVGLITGHPEYAPDGWTDWSAPFTAVVPLPRPIPLSALQHGVDRSAGTARPTRTTDGRAVPWFHWRVGVAGTPLTMSLHSMNEQAMDAHLEFVLDWQRPDPLCVRFRPVFAALVRASRALAHGDPTPVSHLHDVLMPGGRWWGA